MYSETNMLIKGRNHILGPVFRFLHSTKQVIRGTTVYAHPRGVGVSNFSDSKLRRRTLTINPANTVSRRVINFFNEDASGNSDSGIWGGGASEYGGGGGVILD